MEELKEIRIMPYDVTTDFFLYGNPDESEWHPWNAKYKLSMNMKWIIDKEREFCKKYFSYMGNDMTLIKQYEMNPQTSYAFNLEHDLLYLHKFWASYEYKFENGQPYARNKRKGVTYHDIFHEIEKIVGR